MNSWLLFMGLVMMDGSTDSLTIPMPDKETCLRMVKISNQTAKEMIAEKKKTQGVDGRAFVVQCIPPVKAAPKQKQPELTPEQLKGSV